MVIRKQPVISWLLDTDLVFNPNRLTVCQMWYPLHAEYLCNAMGRIVEIREQNPNWGLPHTDKVPTYVSTEYLLRELPGFDWTGGKAGRVLPTALADKLEDIWARYTQKLHDEDSIDGERAAHMEWGDIL